MGIAEFPSVRIDDFKQDYARAVPEIGFLTHMHEDHTGGLARKSYYGPHVYCTAATRALVLNFRTKNGSGELKYGHLRQESCGKEILRALELNKPYVFELSRQTIEATLIDANHCPGAAMVLIKDAKNAVLFTGDLRCEQWHLNSISRTPSLMPFLSQLGGSLPINLYVDDTFTMHVDPLKAYPENREGTQKLAKLLKQYPEDVHFCLSDRVTGHEEMLVALAQELNTRIHMNNYTYNFYLSAVDTSPLAQKLLEFSTFDSADSTARLHFCQRNSDCVMRSPHAPMAYFKPCNQPSAKAIEEQNKILDISGVHPTSMVPFEEDDRVYKGEHQRYFLHKPSKQFFPLFPWFHFSRHASFPELMKLVKMFNTARVKSIHGHSLYQFEVNQTDHPVNSPQLPQTVPAIPLYGDRIKINNLRKANKEFTHSTLSSNSLGSDEELERHAAMALLCRPKRSRSNCSCPNSQPQSQSKSQFQSQSQPQSHSQSHSQSSSQSSSQPGSQMNKRARLNEDSSSLPSPPETRPTSPISDFADDQEEDKVPQHSHRPASPGNMSLTPPPPSQPPQEVDETVDEFTELVDRLRQEPEMWFELKLEYKTGDSVSR